MSLKTSISVIAFASLLLPAITSAQNVAAPTLTLSASKTTISANTNPSYSDLPIISWSSTNATACNAFGTGWSGSVAFSGSQKVNPPVTTTYMMVCVGTGGSAMKSVTITVTSAGTASSQLASVISGFDQVTGNSPATTARTQSGFTYVWNHNLQVGSPYTADVYALQTVLTRNGVYSGDITGGFYNQTFAAVKRFQTKYGIETTGFVGPLTRTKLNGLYGN
ncbi:MAG: peptidoglycan-binding domain-containing protein [Minisyncoccota bacterium]